MAVKAKLKIQLLADSVTVAESEDEDLWRRVLSAMQGAGGLGQRMDEEEPLEEDEHEPKKKPRKGGGHSAFAAELGVSVEELEGACTPEKEQPYIHLDERSWEAFKRNTPQRGPTSVAPIQLAGTLLCLWFKHAGIEGNPTQADAQAVLGTIGERDRNASRSIRNCEWLQSRSNGVRINAARHSRAVSIARAYVKQTKIDSE